MCVGWCVGVRWHRDERGGWGGERPVAAAEHAGLRSVTWPAACAQAWDLEHQLNAATHFKSKAGHALPSPYQCQLLTLRPPSPRSFTSHRSSPSPNLACGRRAAITCDLAMQSNRTHVMCAQYRTNDRCISGAWRAVPGSACVRTLVLVPPPPRPPGHPAKSLTIASLCT